MAGGCGRNLLEPSRMLLPQAELCLPAGTSSCCSEGAPLRLCDVSAISSPCLCASRAARLWWGAWAGCREPSVVRAALRFHPGAVLPGPRPRCGGCCGGPVLRQVLCSGFSACVVMWEFTGEGQRRLTAPGEIAGLLLVEMRGFAFCSVHKVCLRCAVLFTSMAESVCVFKRKNKKASEWPFGVRANVFSQAGYYRFSTSSPIRSADEFSEALFPT